MYLATDSVNILKSKELIDIVNSVDNIYFPKGDVLQSGSVVRSGRTHRRSAAKRQPPAKGTKNSTGKKGAR
jgi:hypothetical protein